MTAPTKLVLFGLVLALVFASALGVGRAVGPNAGVPEDHGRHPASSSAPR